MSDELTPFFHATYVGRLEGISLHGLVLGAPRSIGGAAYDAHAASGVFVTSHAGVPYWYEKAQAFANDQSDDVVADGLVPVMLRVWLDEDDLAEDEVANFESVHAYAFISEDAIDSDDIEVWDGEAWIEIDYWEDVDPERGVDWEEDEDVEEGGYWLFTTSPPLLPEADDLDDEVA